MANRSRVGKGAYDTTTKGTNDPVVAKLKTELAPTYGKLHCNTEDSAKVIRVVMHIQECLFSAHPPSADAWKGEIAQELNAMIETAQQLYEQHTQLSPSTAVCILHGDPTDIWLHFNAGCI
jgi:hypothetical protein